MDIYVGHVVINSGVMGHDGAWSGDVASDPRPSPTVQMRQWNVMVGKTAVA